MATVFYSMAGEGRGHATRVRTVVERLRQEHQVQLFAPGVAYEFLANAYQNTEVKVTKIPGLLFHYRHQKLNYSLTTWEGGKYLWNLRPLITRLRQMLELHEADLVITDFEPAMARAAVLNKVPLISLDHQHFLSVSDLTSLPFSLRYKAEMGAFIVNAYCRGQDETVVSSFYFPPLKRRYINKVQQIGVLLRDEIIQSRPERKDHVLVYLRRFSSPVLMESLRRTGRPVHIYGLGERAQDGNLSFFPVDESRFLDDLVSCDVLVTNAGNQLVGEALYLRKPVFAIPEPRNFEQFINAHFLRESGGGDWCRMEDLQEGRIHQFLAHRAEFQCATDPRKLCGNQDALSVIQRHLTSQPTQAAQSASLEAVKL